MGNVRYVDRLTPNGERHRRHSRARHCIRLGDGFARLRIAGRSLFVLGMLLAAAVCASASGAAESGKTFRLTAADTALIVNSKGQWAGSACVVDGSKTEAAVQCSLHQGGGKARYRPNSYSALINSNGVSVYKVNKSGKITVAVFSRKHSTRTTSAVSGSVESESGASSGGRQSKQYELHPGDRAVFGGPLVRAVVCKTDKARSAMTVQCSIEDKKGVKAGTLTFVFNDSFVTVYRYQGGKFVKAFERKQLQ